MRGPPVTEICKQHHQNHPRTLHRLEVELSEAILGGHCGQYWNVSMSSYPKLIVTRQTGDGAPSTGHVLHTREGVEILRRNTEFWLGTFTPVHY